MQMSSNAFAFAREWSHSHVCFFSYGGERNCGGVAICLSRSFIAGCLLCFGICVVPGRILAVLLISPTQNLLFICIHNAPGWSHVERMAYFKRIRDCIPDCIKVSTFLCGDLNFSHDVIRFNG